MWEMVQLFAFELPCVATGKWAFRANIHFKIKILSRKPHDIDMAG